MTQDKTILSNHALATLTTVIDHPEIEPFMIGVQLAAGVYDITISYSYRGNVSSITLEPCTVTHMHKLANSQTIFNNNQLQNYLCLPLDQSYEIGGPDLSTFISKMELTAACNTTALCSVTNLQIFILSSDINPHNNLHPWLVSLDTFTYKYTGSFKIISHQLKKNTLETDYSVFPLEKSTSSRVGYILSDQVGTDDTQQVGSSGFQIVITSAKKTLLIKRSYLTVLDALSYVGGFFSTLLAIFFFIKLYGQSMFEMQYASAYFRDKDA